MGPQKRTRNKQISILVILGQIGALENLGLEFGGGVISRFPKWRVISRFFWMTAVMSNLLICWHWRISAYYPSVTICICMHVCIFYRRALQLFTNHLCLFPSNHEGVTFSFRGSVEKAFRLCKFKRSGKHCKEKRNPTYQLKPSQILGLCFEIRDPQHPLIFQSFFHKKMWGWPQNPFENTDLLKTHPLTVTTRTTLH